MFFLIGMYVCLVFSLLLTAQLDVWAWFFEHMLYWGLVFLMRCVSHFGSCTFSAQLSMFHRERRSRNEIVVVVIAVVWFGFVGNKARQKQHRRAGSHIC